MIGILTFSNTLNYGALLQEYALYSVISSIDSNVEVINYHNAAIDKRENPLSIKEVSSFKEKIKYILLKNKKKKKKYLFEEFLKNNIMYSQYIDEKNFEIVNKYSKIIVGSDQVWNLNLTSNDFNFYLQGIEDNKKYSYAASFGYSEFKENKEHCVELLSKFNNLYVREFEAVKMLNDEKLEAEVVLDPTFLLSKETWTKNLKLEKRENEKYILVYFLKNSSVNLPMIKDYAKRNNLNIKYVNISPKKVFGVEEITYCNPVEFLNLILNSEVVFTGSYHGLALSLIFNKDVYYMLDKNKNNYNSRINTLIKLFEIQNHELTKENIDNKYKLNYKIINSIIKKERKNSLDLLRRLFNEE